VCNGFNNYSMGTQWTCLCGLISTKMRRQFRFRENSFRINLLALTLFLPEVLEVTRKNTAVPTRASRRVEYIAIFTIVVLEATPCICGWQQARQRRRLKMCNIFELSCVISSSLLSPSFLTLSSHPLLILSSLASLTPSLLILFSSSLLLLLLLPLSSPGWSRRCAYRIGGERFIAQQRTLAASF